MSSFHQPEESPHSQEFVVASEFLTGVLQKLFGPRILDPIFTHHPYIAVFIDTINNSSKAIIEYSKSFIWKTDT